MTLIVYHGSTGPEAEGSASKGVTKEAVRSVDGLTGGVGSEEPAAGGATGEVTGGETVWTGIDVSAEGKSGAAEGSGTGAG